MTTCSELTRTLGEPLIGTAPVATTWLALEQPGPWGRQALTGSHLDPTVGADLERWADGTGVKPLLIRRTGRHADDHRPARHTVLVAHAGPGPRRLHHVEVGDLAAVLAWDAAALGAGRWLPGEPVTGAVALVCTNGRRDRCCAVHGRVLAGGLAERPDRVWECSHLGGHRFAPTAVLLPAGAVYGQLDADRLSSAWAAAERNELTLDGLRGRSPLAPPAQVADAAVRRSSGTLALDALAVSEPRAVEAGRWAVDVRRTDGRSWTVTVAAGRSRPPRPESCGKAAVEPRRWDVVAVEG